MSDQSEFRQGRIVYPKGYGQANYPGPMPSQDEIELLAHLQVMGEQLQMLSQLTEKDQEVMKSRKKSE